MIDMDAIVYSMYLEYMEKRGTILDKSSIQRATQKIMEDNDRVYSLINILRLYMFAGFTLKFEDVNANRFCLELNKREVVIELANFVSVKDCATLTLDAISCQSAYSNSSDSKLAICKELKTYYERGRNFNSMLVHELQGKNVSNEILQAGINSCVNFLNSYIIDEKNDVAMNNILNIVVSEVKEDLEELVCNRK